MFKLVIQDDEGKTTVVPLIRDEITIGRKEGNTIRLTERNVSRRHARIARSNNEVTIEDLGSYNGIRVNNSRIAERVSLRLSDQVQIGDYKLYLKSEAVEASLDDGRTIPHERVDPTEAMSSVSEPTQEMAAIPAATAAALAEKPPESAPRLVGNPARTMVAVDSGPLSGRPVATAAAVQALQQTTGYGKFVVISSNFAGEEFDLSRPQMIIGRTEDNDIVIDHRSMSRNHAKVVRNPDNGRYTISDLQSSNGLRINGHDYAKHELTRGDTIDLGHVRIRYVEPGEDFILGRDAQITDVATGGGGKGKWLAIGLVGAAAAAVAIFLATRGGKSSSDGAGSGSSIASAGNGTQTNSLNGSGSDTIATNNGNGSGSGSNLGSAVESGSNTGSADPMVAAAAEFNKKFSECQTLADTEKWADAASCADGLATSTAGGDQAKAFATKSRGEIKSLLAFDDMKIAYRQKDYALVATKSDKIPADSAYRAKADELNDKARTDFIAAKERTAKSLASQGKCAELERLIATAESVYVESREKLAAIQCDRSVATVDPIVKKPPNPNGNGSGSNNVVKEPGNGSNTTVVAPKNCDAEALSKEGDSAFAVGSGAQALARYEAAMRCSGLSNLARRAGMAACIAKNPDRARYWVSKAGTGASAIHQKCQMLGVNIQ